MAIDISNIVFQRNKKVRFVTMIFVNYFVYCMYIDII